MKKAIFLGLMVLILVLSGCKGAEGPKVPSANAKDVERLQQGMEDRGHRVELLPVGPDILEVLRLRMRVDEADLDLYLYDTVADLEKDVRGIGADGSSYEKGGVHIEISWVSYPHFYKNGTVIVLYVGENPVILSDLQVVLGLPFAGYRE